MLNRSWRRAFVVFSVTAFGIGLGLTVAGSRLSATNNSVGLVDRLFGRGSGTAEVSVADESRAEARRREVRRQISDPGLLLLTVHTFDPLSDNPVPMNLSGPRVSVPPSPSRLGKDYFIVQSQGRIDTDFRERLIGLGVEILGYIPNNAYLVRATGAQASQARALGKSRWVGSWLAEYRLSPDLREMVGKSTDQLPIDEFGNLPLHVAFFPGEALSDYESLVTNAVPGIAVSGVSDGVGLKNLGDPRAYASIRLSVPPGSLNTFLNVVTHIGGVRAVEVNYPKNLRNDFLIPRVLSGSQNVSLDITTAKPYANGLWGTGEIISVADSGLEWDACYFRYGSDPSDLVTPASVPAGSATPVQIDDACNKVIAYYVQSLATAGDPGASHHGTHVTGNVAADNYVFLAARCDKANPTAGVRRVDDPTREEFNNPPYGGPIDMHNARDAVAAGAQIVFQDFGDDTGQLRISAREDEILGQAYFSGSRQHNASYGSLLTTTPPGSYGLDSGNIDFTLWRLRDMTHARAVGNDGPGSNTVAEDADCAKNHISVGATDSADPSATNFVGQQANMENVETYTSRGPIYDSRMRPEICVPGDNSAAWTSNPGNGNNECQSTYGLGTSFASPVVVGMSAIINQYFKDGFYPSGSRTRPEGSPIGDPVDPASGDSLIPTNALIKALLINGAKNLTGVSTGGSRPANGQGWGLPILDDALYFAGDTRKLLILSDTPNGLANATQINDSRSRIMPGFSAAIQPGQVKTFNVNVLNDQELRVTLCWMDNEGAFGSGVALVNDLDIEVEGPDPLNPADYVVWRPESTAWTGGTIDRSKLTEPKVRQDLFPPFSKDPDQADRLNNCENIFLKSSDLVSNSVYRIRIIGYNVPGGSSCNGCGRPNWVNAAFDGSDVGDNVNGQQQGFALIVSGSFTTTQGFINFNKSGFTCGGDSAIITLNDENGDSNSNLDVTVTTTSSDPSFPTDYEKFVLTGTQPLYETREFPVKSSNIPTDVIHGDGVITLKPGEIVKAEYIDENPAGGRASAQALLSCAATFSNEGYFLDGGCDLAKPQDPINDPFNTIQPDQFLDADEIVTYTVLFGNTSPFDLQDVQVVLTPLVSDPLNPEATVLGNPQSIGEVPSGRRASAKFQVRMGPAAVVSPRERLDFRVDIYSPKDNITTPFSFIQTQTLEADFETFIYSTRDPRGTLWGNGVGKVQEFLGGDRNNPNNYRTFNDLTMDPGTDGYGANDVPSANSAVIPDPWDFDDDDEGFLTYPYPEIDGQLNEFTWSNQGGCGYEDEVNAASGANGRGIFHTGTTIGAIHPNTPPATPNLGPDPTFDVITAAPNNKAPLVCSSYAKKSSVVGFPYTVVAYELKPPTIAKVTSSSAYTVAFRQMRWYERMDGHLISQTPFNASIAYWLADNNPVDPIGPGQGWANVDYEYGTGIYSDDVDTTWTDNNNVLTVNLSQPDATFADRSYEDVYGPAGDSWDFMFTWAIFYASSLHTNQYGWGMDDLRFEWSESRERDDQTDCAAVYPVKGFQPVIFFNSQRFSTCDGVVGITLIDPGNPNQGTIQVLVSSFTEDSPGEMVTLTQTADATGTVYAGSIKFTTNPANNVVGVLYVAAGSRDAAQGADDIFVEYDPNDPDGNFADWVDADLDGENDDLLNNCDGSAGVDGIPDEEDDACVLPDTCPTFDPQCREVFDFAFVNCTSGGVYYIKHDYQQVQGDSDAFADHNEIHDLRISLYNNTSPDVTNTTVVISTQDPTICILDSTSFYGTLMGVTQAQILGIDPLTNTPLTDMFRIGVPNSTRSTVPNNIQKATIRIDIFADNYSTGGDTFSAFAPLTFTVPLDLDTQVAVSGADWIENFDSLAADKFEKPGWNNRRLDATLINSFKHDANGFCSPDCGACSVPTDCDFPFNGQDALQLNQWHPTTSIKYSGGSSYYMGVEGATGDPDRYTKGQFSALESPPVRISNDSAVTPLLSWWQISDPWQPNFTNGLSTPIGTWAMEIQSSTTSYNESGWQKLYPIQGPYNISTDALNACRTYACNTHHVAWGGQGDFFATAGNGIGGKGNFFEIIADLSPWKGQEIKFRWVIEVPSDIDVSPGNPGLLVDAITISGVSSAIGYVGENGDTDALSAACGLISDFEPQPTAACINAPVQLVDRHAGLGIFNGGQPYPIEFRWDFNGDATTDLTCMEGSAVTPGPLPGVGALLGGDCDNPILTYSTAATYFPILQLFQNAILQATSTTGLLTISPPLAVDFTVSSPVFQDGKTFFTAVVSGGASQNLTYVWDFNDQASAFPGVQVQEYIFQNPGLHNVTLTVIDRDGGCQAAVTKPINVATPPVISIFGTSVSDPGCGAAPGNNDNEVDLNEFVTITLTISNSGAAAATNVVGELSTNDPLIDMYKAASEFTPASIAPAGGTGTGTFSFIVDATHSPTGSLLFNLDLYMNGRTVTDRLVVGVPLGNAVAGSQLLTGNRNGDNGTDFICDSPGDATCPADQTWDTSNTVPTGAVTGLHLMAYLQMTGPASQSNVDNLQVTVKSPAGSSFDIWNASAGGQQFLRLDVAFSVSGQPIDNSSPPLPAGVPELFQLSMTGAAASGGPWQLIVRDIVNSVNTDTNATTQLSGSGAPGSNWTLDVQYETNLDVDTLAGNADQCKVDLAPPIFDGLTSNAAVRKCSQGGFEISWIPAIDQEDQMDDDQIADRAPITYTIYRSNTAGTQGVSVGTTVNQTIFFNAALVSGTNYCYTVLAKDAANHEQTFDPADQRCFTYDCSGLPGPILIKTTTPAFGPRGSFMRLVPSGGGRETVEVELCATCTDPLATSYRMYRGHLDLLHQAVPTYDHSVNNTQGGPFGDCTDSALVLRDADPNAGHDGINYYYLVVGVNAVGEGPYGEADLDGDGLLDPGESLPDDTYSGNTRCP